MRRLFAVLHREADIKAFDIAQASNDPGVLELLEFWETSRGNNKYPSQRDLDLMQIPELVPNFFILDYLEDTTFQYRYVGSAIDVHFGVYLTGRNLGEYRSGKVLDVLVDFFTRVITKPQMGILTTRLESESLDWAVYTRVGLPVADDHETPNKVVGLTLIRHNDDALAPAPNLIDVEQQNRAFAIPVYGDL